MTQLQANDVPGLVKRHAQDQSGLNDLTNTRRSEHRARLLPRGCLAKVRQQAEPFEVARRGLVRGWLAA